MSTALLDFTFCQSEPNSWETGPADGLAWVYERLAQTRTKGVIQTLMKEGAIEEKPSRSHPAARASAAAINFAYHFSERRPTQRRSIADVYRQPKRLLVADTPRGSFQCDQNGVAA